MWSLEIPTFYGFHLINRQTKLVIHGFFSVYGLPQTSSSKVKESLCEKWQEICHLGKAEVAVCV